MPYKRSRVTSGFEHYAETLESRELEGLPLFLYENPDIDPVTILSLPQIPALIGGVKSRHFVIRDPESKPDTPPDPGSMVDLRSMVVREGGLQGFSDWFNGVEAQAEEQYPLAVLETRKALETAAEQGISTAVIFVPDYVNDSARSYMQRLNRLSRDVGHTVVIRVEVEDNLIFFETFPREALWLQ